MSETASGEYLTSAAPIDDTVSSSSSMDTQTSGTGSEGAENAPSEPDPLRDFVSSRPIADQIVFEMFLEQYPETGWDVLSKLFQDMLAEHDLEDESPPDAPGETVGIYGTFGFQYMAAVQAATFMKVVAGSLPDSSAGGGPTDFGLNVKAMKSVSTSMSYSHWAADTVQNMSRKVNSFWNDADDTGKGFMAAEAVLSGAQVMSNIMYLRALHVTRKQAEMMLEIRQFHSDIETNGTEVVYQNNNKDDFNNEKKFSKLLEMHREFLVHNAEHLQTNREALDHAKETLDTANTALGTATRALATAEASQTTAQELKEKIEAAIEADRKTNADDWKSLTPEAQKAKEDKIAQHYLDANADLQGHTSENWKQVVDGHIATVNAQASAAQEELTRAEGEQTLAQENQNRQDVLVQGLEAATETLNKQDTWANDIPAHLTQDSDTASHSMSRWGMADNGISMLRSAAGLGFWSHEGSSAELYASFGLGIASDGLYTGQSTADLLDGHATKSAALGLFASTLGVASAAVGLADITRQLDNPDLTDDQRDALKQAAGLQGTMMAAMAAEGALAATAMLSHSAKALKFATTGVPIAGAVVTLLSVLDPVSWQRFEAAKDYINHLRKFDDGTETNGLLADRLEDTYDKEVAHYAAATAVDAAFGLASIAIASTGVGAPVAVAVALVGAAISTIIRLTDGNKWQEEADKLADQMRSLPDGSQQTIAQFFEKQLDTRWEAVAAENEERFDKILEKNFDSVIGLGSQSFTDADASLAIQSDTISEMGKTAKHYGSEYLGQGTWDHQSVTLDETAATIDLPNGDADKAVYLTFMTPLMLATEDVYSRPMFNTGKGGSTTTHVSGWTITDGTTIHSESSQPDGGKPPLFSFYTPSPIQRAEWSQTSTTFDVTNVITDFVPLHASRTVVEDLSLKINALGGNDTYLADQAKVVFNGGAGEDTASYLNIDDDRFARGIQATANGANRINVEKHLAAGSEYLQEVIKTKREQAGTDMWGKAKYKTVEYRAIEVAQHQHETTVVDLLVNIEVLQASDLDDILDLRGNTTVQRIFGFDGDDQIYAGNQTKVVLAGNGDDHIVTGARSEYIDAGAGSDVIEAGKTLAHLLQKVAAGTADRDDAVFLFGGDDIDAVVFDGETMQALREQYAEQQVAAAIVEYQLGQLAALGVNLEVARAIFEDQILGTSGDDFGLALFKGIEHLVFDLADIKPPVDTGMNGAAFTHYIYDLTAPRTAEETDGGPPLTLSEFLSDPNNSIEDWLLPVDGYALPAASRTDTRTDDVLGSLSTNELHHFVGQVYLETGVTYEFQESGDSQGAVYLRHSQAGDDVDRTQVLREATSGAATTGAFTATQGGWYNYDYYAQTADAGGSASLLIRDFDANTAFQTLNGQDDPSLRLGFSSPMLAGSNVAEAVLDNHWHAQDFNTMIASVLQASHGLPFLTRNTSSEIYNGAGTTYTETMTIKTIGGKGRGTSQITTEHIRIDLADWAEQNQADRVEVHPGRIQEDDIAERGLLRYQGEIWLQEGETYKFREKTEDKMLFTLQGGGTNGAVTILQDDRANHHTEAAFTATASGWYDFDFYAWNKEGPGTAKLEIGVVSQRDDAGDPTEWQFQTLEGNMAMAAKLDATGLDSGTMLQGAQLGESFIGSAHDDLIYGMDGHDRMDGGGGSDAMSGGDGIDTFVFRQGSGHDLIMELYASDWEDNLIEIEGNQVKRNRSDDDLILWFAGNTDDSLTLLNYYSDGAQADAGSLRQHLLFANGKRETVDTLSNTGADNFWFRKMLASRNDAFDQSNVIQAAIETEESKDQFIDGSYRQDLLGSIEDWLGLG